MRLYRFVFISTVSLALLGHAEIAVADEGPNESEIERTRRVGTGLLWGGVATMGAGGLTLLGLIPAHRNVRSARADLDVCRVPKDGIPEPECSRFEDELARSLRARTIVAVVGSALLASGAVLTGVGGWKRRVARRQQLEYDRQHQPEWSVLPYAGPRSAGMALHLRF